MNQRKVADLRKRSLKFWALSVSIIIHIVVLSCFAVVNFSEHKDKGEPRKAVGAKFRVLQEYIRNQPVVKKPEFKTLADSAGRVYELEETGGSKYTVKSPSSGKETGSFEPSRITAGKIETDGLSESKVSFFDSTAYARKVCYVVDCSGSMKGIFSGVQKKLEQSVRELRQDQFFEIIFFNENVTGFSSGNLARASEETKRKAIRFVGIMKPSGVTNALDALKQALRVRDAGGEPVRVIYFLTDGFELSGEEAETFNRAVDILLERTTRDIRINVIAFYPQHGDKAILARIARKTGGEMVVIDR